MPISPTADLRGRVVTSLFGTGSRGPINQENYGHIREIEKNCTPDIFSFRFSVILKIQCSLKNSEV